MATEKRLIDANASIKYFEKAKEIVKVIPGELGNILRGFYDEVIEEIKKQPTVDAVEVVRCKDCKKRYTENCFMALTRYSVDMDANPDGIIVEWTADDDFCSYGERREGE